MSVVVFLGNQGDSSSCYDFMDPSKNSWNLPLAKQWRCNQPWMPRNAIPLDERTRADLTVLRIRRCYRTRIVDESFDWRPHLCWSHIDQTPAPKFPDTRSRNHKCRRKGRCTSFHTKSEPAIQSVTVIQKKILMYLYCNRPTSWNIMNPCLNLAAL